MHPHACPTHTSPHIPTPTLYTPQIDPSLVRTVDLGPFKHQIDDGLELRKTAFECLDVMLDVCPQAVDIDQHVATLQSGLGVCVVVCVCVGGGKGGRGLMMGVVWESDA